MQVIPLVFPYCLDMPRTERCSPYQKRSSNPFPLVVKFQQLTNTSGCVLKTTILHPQLMALLISNEPNGQSLEKSL